MTRQKVITPFNDFHAPAADLVLKKDEEQATLTLTEAVNSAFCSISMAYDSGVLCTFNFKTTI